MSEENEMLTDRHFYLFGYITHMRAAIESEFVTYVAARCEIDYITASILCAPYSAGSLKDVVSGLVRFPPAEKGMKEQMGSFLGRFHEIGQLRNHIAHDTWAAGKRPESIKPLSLGVRGRKIEIKGVTESEADYTLDEFAD